MLGKWLTFSCIYFDICFLKIFSINPIYNMYKLLKIILLGNYNYKLTISQTNKFHKFKGSYSMIEGGNM